MNELSKHSQIPHDFIQSAFITSNIVQVFFLFLIFVQNEEDFAKEKEQELEIAAGPESKPLDGWNRWAGEGIFKPKIDPSKLMAQRKQKIVTSNIQFLNSRIQEKLKENRSDGKLDNVILSEKREKQFNKYLVSEVPHPYQSIKQYEDLMSTPLGKINLICEK